MRHWKIIGTAVAVVVLGVGIFWLVHDRHREFVGVQEDVSSESEAAKPKELKVVMHSPEGPGVAIDTDGITVMFNQAMVPLTTLAEGKEHVIPLQITPAVEGTVHWLGTHALIFRPNQPLSPATRYQVSIPGPLTSVEGLTLQGPIAWEFTTVRPKVLHWKPRDGEEVLPQQAIMRVTFNMAMDRADVARKLKMTMNGRTIPAAVKWEDGDHIATLIFNKSLPWDAEIRLSLEKGARSKYGEIGTETPSEVRYGTPTRTFELDTVEVRPYGGHVSPFTIEAGKKSEAPVGSSVCFDFGAPIRRAAFEKALSVKGSDQQLVKARVYTYSSSDYAYIGKDNRVHRLSGYTTLCADGLRDYFREYHFTIDPTALTAITGATYVGKRVTYSIQTPHAKPSLASGVTKNILMAMGPMKLPYRATNLDKLQVRIYPFPDPAYFSEDIRDTQLTIQKKYDNSLNKYVDLPLPNDLLLPGGYKLVLDPKTHAIASSALKPTIVHDIPITAATDTETKVIVDLEHLGKVTPVKPGLYLIEAIGMPRDGGAAPFPIYTAVQVSPIALAIKDDVQQMLVWATDIATGAPVADLPLQSVVIESKNNQTIWKVKTEAKTNADGIATIETPSVQCIQVGDPARYALTCKDWHRLNRHRMMNGGWNYYAYVYTDRPIYRPGQPIYFSSIVRQVQEGHYFRPVDPDGEPITAAVSVVDAAGTRIYERKEVPVDKAGVVSGTLTLDPSEKTPRGTYELSIVVSGQEFTRKFYVASYRKPAFKVDLSELPKEIVNKDKLDTTVSAQYLFGMPLGKAGVTWSIMTSTYAFRPEGYERFSFVDPDLLQKTTEDDGEGYYASEYEYDEVDSSEARGTPESNGQVEDPKKKGSAREPDGFFKDPGGKEAEGFRNVLDANGHFKLTYTPDLQKYPTSQILTVETSVEDLSHQQVSAAEDVVVHKADVYVGVAPRKWAYGETEEAEMDVVALTPKGKPMPNTAVTAQVVRREYQFIERQNANGNWEYVFAPKDTEIHAETLQTDDKGMSVLHFTIPQGGSYRAVVKAVDGRGNAVQSATEIFAWGKGYAPWRLTDIQKLELVPDKDSYKIGETAKVLVKSLVPVTKALFTLERGRVLEYKMIELGGNAGHLKIPIIDGLIPNIYVSVVAQTGKTDGHAPLVFYGETELKVAPDSKRLTVKITPDRKGQGAEPPSYGSGDEVKIKIHTQDPQGKPVSSQVMVSVADESVLRLVGYQLPDLVEKFYYRRANNVESSSSMVSLKAGDGGMVAGKKRRNFRDTADFQAYLETNAAGDAEFSFKLPDDLTTWVVEALAASRPMNPQTGAYLAMDDHHFVGGARTKIMSTKPVLIRAALPRFMVWGDQVQGRAIITNRTDKAVTGKLKLSVMGDAVLSEDKTDQELPFTVAANRETTVPIDLVVTFTNGHLAVSAEAVDGAGKPLDGVESNFIVYDRDMPEVVATSGVTRGAAIEKLALPSDTIADRGGLEVSLRASLAMAITPYLKGLIDYPYGCAEQKSSRLLALLMARQLSAIHGEAFYDRVVAPDIKKKLDVVPGWDLKKKILDSRIEDTIQDLADNYQGWDGGIRYWEESEKSDAYLSGQVYWAWHLAKSLQYKVPEGAMKNLAQYLSTELGRKSDDRNRPSPATLSYLLWVVTLDGGWAPTEAVDFVETDLSRMRAQQLAYLTMAFANHGDQKKAETFAQKLRNMAKQTPRKTQWDADWTFDYIGGDAAKVTALAATALFVLDHGDALVPRAMASVLMQRMNRNVVVTQDALAVAWLIYQYSNTFKEGGTDFKAEVTVDGTPLLATTFSAKELLKQESRFTPLKDLLTLPMPSRLKVAKAGEGSLYYDLVLKYYLPLNQVPPRSEGVVITRNYYALSDTKEKNPLTEFIAGQNYKAHVTVVVPQRMNYAVVQDQLPAGFEAIDMKLATSSKATGLSASEENDGEQLWWSEYADQVVVRDFGCNCRLTHQEIHDDMILWSDPWLSPGVYHLRYPVRATTAGIYNSGFATAFAFYEPEIFGRSQGRRYTIRESSDGKSAR